MFLREVRFVDWPDVPSNYPFHLPAFQGIEELSFETAITFFVGENGSGKSTLLEAIAIGAGFNPEGGGRNNSFATARTESLLHEHIRMAWLPKPTQGFFLRAESFFNFATYIEETEKEPFGATGFRNYGGKSLHERSHGESFLTLLLNRLQPSPQTGKKRREKALYLLDEPEAALSPTHQLALLRILHDLELGGDAQVIIATHSPILLGYPNARILNFDTSPVGDVHYEETEHYAVTKEFLNRREHLLHELFVDDADC